MGDSRSGLGANLTPLEAKENLAIPVVYILLGKALPIFPGTSRASQSRLVRIQPKIRQDQYLSGFVAGFPVIVNWRQWQLGVVPVLKDPRWDVSQPINRVFLQTDLAKFVDLVGEALKLSFHEAGFGPLDC